MVSFVQNNLREKLHKLASEKSNIVKEIDRLEPGKEEVTLYFGFIHRPFSFGLNWYFWHWLLTLFLQLETRIAAKELEVRKLEKKINEIVDKVYRDFSISVGVKNIREYEERQLKEAQALQERKLSLNNQMSKLKYQYVTLAVDLGMWPFFLAYRLNFASTWAQFMSINVALFCRLEYEQKRDMNAPIVKLKEMHESLEKELKSLQEREADAKAEAEQILNQMDELKAEAEGAHWKYLLEFLIVISYQK
jgi:structural maintenance of chromosome 1